MVLVNMSQKLMAHMMGNGLMAVQMDSAKQSTSKEIVMKVYTKKIFDMALGKIGTQMAKDTKVNSSTAVNKGSESTTTTTATDMKEIGQMTCAKVKAEKFIQMDHIMLEHGNQMRNMVKENYIQTMGL